MPDRSTAYQLQRRKNLRLALILASVALVFLLGFVFKMAWLR
ncbi:cytochrome oxidase small assembly protein [Comamonas sp. GB3 AK4-5]